MENIKRWKRPQYYIGADWPEYYVFLGQHRDSGSVTRSNFIAGLNAIGGESETVLIIRENHFAVGWVEWIAIHESDTKALTEADEILGALEDYPVVSEEHLSELEFNEACKYWEQCSIKERIHYCDKADISIFSARKPDMPIEVLDFIRY